MFRGREMAHTELGRKILDRLVADLGELVVVESHAEARGTQHDHGDLPEQAVPRGGQAKQRAGRHGAVAVVEPVAVAEPEPAEAAGTAGTDGVIGAGRRSNRPPQPTKGRTTMPKMKTHRAAAKRFRVTRRGKVLHRKATGNHMLTKKTGSRRRRVEGMAEVTGHPRAEEAQATAGEVTTWLE